MSIKNPLTPAGIEPTTFRFVAQHLNHCATAVPSLLTHVNEFLSVHSLFFVPYTRSAHNSVDHW